MKFEDFLAAIEASGLSGAEMHRQFVDGGVLAGDAYAAVQLLAEAWREADGDPRVLWQTLERRAGLSPEKAVLTASAMHTAYESSAAGIDQEVAGVRSGRMTGGGLL